MNEVSARASETASRTLARQLFWCPGLLLKSGATQWMEIAYAYAFGIPTFILLHHLTFEELKRADRGVPPLILEGQCTPAGEWRSLENDLRKLLQNRSV